MNNYEELRKQYDSDEEVYFVWYLEELKDKGYIYYYSRAETINLSQSVKREYKERLKTKDRISTQHVLNGSEYTPDFKIIWNQKAVGKFVHIFDDYKKSDCIYYCDQNLVSIVEIKGMFDRNNMIRLVMTNIKWVFDKHDIFVNLIKVPKIFADTFTPQRYLWTNKTKDKRNIKWKIKLIQ